MTAVTMSLVITGVSTLLFELATGLLSGGRNREGRGMPRPVKVFGILAGVAAMSLLGLPAGQDLSTDPENGLLGVLVGGVLLYAIAAPSDFRGPRSLRHFVATMVAAVCLYAGGLEFSHVTIPGIGLVDLHGIPSLVFTLLWVFLVVGIMELCSMVPVLSSLIALVLGGMVFLPLPIRETFPGQVLGGALIGVTLGRLLGEILRGHTRPSEKTENLLLGYLVAAATLSMFIKGFTATSLILPITLFTLLMVILVLQSLERSLILRPSPRD